MHVSWKSKKTMLLLFTTRIIFLLFFYYSCTDQNDSPCILQATYDLQPATSSFNFMQDGTFEWINGSGLSIYTYEGKYFIHDSIIRLDKIGFDSVIISNLLLITNRDPATQKSGKFLIQINNQNKLIDSNYIFTIYIDKTKF